MMIRSHRSPISVRLRQTCRFSRCRRQHPLTIHSQTRHRIWTRVDRELTHQVNDTSQSQTFYHDFIKTLLFEPLSSTDAGCILGSNYFSFNFFLRNMCIRFWTVFNVFPITNQCRRHNLTPCVLFGRSAPKNPLMTLVLLSSDPRLSINVSLRKDVQGVTSMTTYFLLIFWLFLALHPFIDCVNVIIQKKLNFLLLSALF